MDRYAIRCVANTKIIMTIHNAIHAASKNYAARLRAIVLTVAQDHQQSVPQEQTTVVKYTYNAAKCIATKTKRT